MIKIRSDYMPKFNSIKEIEEYLKHNVAEIVRQSPEIERVLESVMRQKVMEVVYGAYEPSKYKRRKDEGGLSDPRNFAITSVDIIGNNILLKYENLTEGNDSLRGEYIGDLIEYGQGYNGKTWSREGKWSKPRPFAEEAQKFLRDNPQGLKRALRKSLTEAGFRVR